MQHHLGGHENARDNERERYEMAFVEVERPVEHSTYRLLGKPDVVCVIGDRCLASRRVKTVRYFRYGAAFHISERSLPVRPVTAWERRHGRAVQRWRRRGL